MNHEPKIYVVGRSIHVPGYAPSTFRADMSDEPSCTPDDAHSLLGRKGLRSRDAASRLALCAVAVALREVDEWRGAPVASSAAVVVGCSLGNVDTVVGVTEDLMTSGDRHLSPLAAANLSSNNVSAAVSIWFKMTGPSLTLCTGDRASADALAVSSLILRSGRCRDAIVVGVEVENDTSSALYSHGGGKSRLQTQAGAVVLSRDSGTIATCDLHAPVCGPMPASSGSPTVSFTGGAAAVLSLARRSRVGQRITGTQYRSEAWEE